MDSRKSVSKAELASRREARRFHYERLWGTPVQTYEPLMSSRTPAIELLEFRLAKPSAHWVYATSGISDPRRVHRDYLEVEVPARTFEIVAFTIQRAPWIHVLLSDLGHFCFDKDASLRNGQMLQPGTPLDRGLSHLKVALFVEGLAPSLHVADETVTFVNLVGLTEPERNAARALNQWELTARDWVESRKLVVNDLDRACTVNETLAKLDAPAATFARLRSFPNAPPLLMASLQAIRTAEKLQKAFEERADPARIDRELEILSGPLIKMRWDIVDIRGAEDARILIGRLQEKFQRYLESWT